MSCDDANIDDGKGIMMNGMATGNVPADGFCQGMASNSSLKMPHVGDTDVDGGMGIEINVTASENDQTTQVIDAFAFCRDVCLLYSALNNLFISCFCLLFISPHRRCQMIPGSLLKMGAK